MKVSDVRSAHGVRDALATNAVITYTEINANGERLQARAHYVYILNSGWLRVTWLDGTMTLLSPAAVREVSGKGVEYA